MREQKSTNTAEGGACLFSRSYPIVLADQGAPLLTRFAHSSTRRVARGQPMTTALRWDLSGLGQSRPIRPENDNVDHDQNTEHSRPGAIHWQRELVSPRD